jgi:hypothetical protein
MMQKNRHDRPAGDTGISLGAEPLKIKHYVPLTLLDITFVKSTLSLQFQSNPHSKALEVFPAGLPMQL